MATPEIVVVELGLPGPAGSGVTASQLATINANIATLQGQVGVVVQDEGTPLATNGTTLNFVGAGVTATGGAATKTITIPSTAFALSVHEGATLKDAAVIDLVFDAIDFDIVNAAHVETITTQDYPCVHIEGSNDASVAVTTSLATMHSVDLPALVLNKTYDIKLTVGMRGSVSSGGYCIAYARIGGDSSIAGTKTGTVGGERWITSTVWKMGVVGDGVSVTTVYARAAMDTGTGTATGIHIYAEAIPR